MTDRADYIRGLCELASLLSNNDDLELPYEGIANEITIFPHNAETALAQAVTCIRNMEPKPTVEIRPAPNVVWLSIHGRIAGLRIEASLRADHVCERRTGSVYRTPDGEIHPVIDYVIPAAILDAIEGR
ncbi:hypothetical protein ABZ912_19760 [Nonomuraea angiospora]|uniref:hypothetical protein n=1 Tax=Nonomuraea angiospora TaxID=46172 RepID=UPI0034028F9E